VKRCNTLSYLKITARIYVLQCCDLKIASYIEESLIGNYMCLKVVHCVAVVFIADTADLKISGFQSFLVGIPPCSGFSTFCL
jgi:hypothetical protein